jgi:thiopeptide-type bacteriocin biosynthesis protein
MWLAAYLYYTADWEDFLIKSVKPFVETIMRQKLADQYFFIRYWENGPHIRLRFKGNDEILLSKVKPMLEDHFNSWFKKFPSERETPEWTKKLPEKDRWFPNNTIQFIEYEPEVERYGGPVAIEIAERQFQLSSDAILSIISQSEAWTYERALGAAIQLHLGFSYALGMSLEEMKRFYTFVFTAWLPRAYGYNPDAGIEINKTKQKVVLDAFEKTFLKQKDMLIPYHQTIWNAFHENVEFEDEWLNIWIFELKKINLELQEIQKKRQMKFHKIFQPNSDLPVNVEKQLFWPIMESYVHMTNNRLGVLNQDEGYLGYLINKSLESLK